MYRNSDKYYSLNYEYETIGYYKKTFNSLKKRIDLENKEILEIGSGTGFYPIRYAKLNSNTTCLDISDNFIKIFNNNLNELPQLKEKIRIIKQDFRSFNLEKKFDLIFMIGSSLIYILNKDEQISCLRSIRNHLKENGKAYINFWTIGNRISKKFHFSRTFYNPILKSKINEKAFMVTDFKRHEIDYFIEYRFLNGNNRNKIVHEKLKTRMIFPTEFELLLDISYLKINNIYGNYLSRRIANNTFEYYYEVSI